MRHDLQQLLGISKSYHEKAETQRKMKDTRDSNFKEEEILIPQAPKDGNARMEKNIKEIESSSMV